MAALRQTVPMRAPHQRGFTMLEILVTLAIVTIWLLATAGVQSSSAKLNKAAQFRTEAVFLASEMAERIEANKEEAVKGTYECMPNPCATTDTPTGCIAASCDSAELAAFDKAEWGNRVAVALPVEILKIEFAAGSPATYTITIGWTDRRGNRTYQDPGTTESYKYVATKMVFFDPG